MWLWLTIAGVGSIGYGAWLKVRRMEDWDSEESMAIYRDQIDHHREEFLNQFRLSQESLEALYSEDLTELKQELRGLALQMSQIQAFLRESESERKLEGRSLSPQKKAQIKRIWELNQEGCSDEEIARELKMGLGEVLLLKQLHN